MSEEIKQTKEEKKAAKQAKKQEKIRLKQEKEEKEKLEKLEKAKKKEAAAQQKEERTKPQIGDPVLPPKEEKGVISMTLSAFNAKEAPVPDKKALEKKAKEQEKQQKKAKKEKEEQEKAEKKRLEAGDFTLYERFEKVSFVELEQLLHNSKSREERAFYRSLLNLKLQIEQEKVIGEVLL